MVDNSSGSDSRDWTVPNDPRRTRIGTFLRRFSIDELPNLINVLAGHMSLVGPRAEQPQYVRRFSTEIPRYMERHREKSGMTGWAQVNGLRGDVPIDQRTQYDLYYIENWSVFFDIRILLRHHNRRLQAACLLAAKVHRCVRKTAPLSDTTQNPQRERNEGQSMRITEITHRTYQWPRRKPIRNGMFTYTNVTLSVVEIETDAGLVGLGLGGVNHSLLEQFKPLLIGEDPVNVERLWHALWVPKLVGRRGTETRTISSLDIALWDLIGKATGKSVHQLLGGYAERIPVYIAGGYYEEGKGLKELAEEMEENLRLAPGR